MGTVRLQTAYRRSTGLPEDDVVMTLYASDLTAGAASAGDAEDMLDSMVGSFIDTPFTWYSEVMGTTVVGKAFDMEDAEPRVPIVEKTYTVNDSTSDGLPSEVALCLSFEAEAVSGMSQRRRRGRVFIGPLAVAACGTSDVSGDPRPTSGVLNAFDAAYISFRTGVEITGDYHHVVYSPTQHASGTLLSSLSAVEHAWIDNAFDTQRRRGTKATTRQVVYP